jgi:hypothetical protein
MFRKVLQSLSRSLSSKPKAEFTAKRAAQGSLLERVAHPPGNRAGVPSNQGKETAESLCGISPKMPRDQVAAQIKLLYRRYNRAASSLDVNVRAEAERMLDAIVEVREKWFGPI